MSTISQPAALASAIGESERNLQRQRLFVPSPLFGLANLGNTCYFNSGLQLLSSSPEFLSSLAFSLAENPLTSKETDGAHAVGFFNLLSSRRGTVDVAHFNIWLEAYELLYGRLAKHFEDVLYSTALRKKEEQGDSERAMLDSKRATDVAAYIDANIPTSAVMQVSRPIPPVKLLRNFSLAHPVFEGMMQQDTSEMLNQLLSSLDDVCRMDQFPHWLLASLRATRERAVSNGEERYECAQSPSAVRALMVIELMHLINLDNARKHCHTAAFKKVSEHILTIEERGDMEQESLIKSGQLVTNLELAEQKEVLLTNPPTAPRLFSSAHNNMFRSHTLSTVTCHRCLNQSCSVQEYTSLSIAIPSEAARKRYAAENPEFVFKMRQRWHYNAERQYWWEKVIRLSNEEVKRLSKARKASLKNEQAPDAVASSAKSPSTSASSLCSNASSVAHACIATMAAFTGIYTFQQSRSTLSGLPGPFGLPNDVKSLGLGAIAAAGTVAAGKIVKNFLIAGEGDIIEGVRIGTHFSTRAVTLESVKRIRAIRCQLTNLPKHTAGLSQKEINDFRIRCEERIEDEIRVATNVLALFGERKIDRSDLNLFATTKVVKAQTVGSEVSDEEEDDDSASSSLTFSNFDLQRPKAINMSTFIPHPSASAADVSACPYMTSLKSAAYSLQRDEGNVEAPTAGAPNRHKMAKAAENLFQRCQYQGQSSFAAGDIDYPLTLEECLGIYTSPNYISGSVESAGSVRNLLAKRKEKPGYAPEGFRCENCCYGGTVWRRDGGTGTSIEGSLASSFSSSDAQNLTNICKEILASRVTSDVTLQTKLLSLPHNLLINLKRVRPPDDIVDADEGGNNNYLVKIEDPVLFPYPHTVEEIVISLDKPIGASCSAIDGNLDMAPYMAEVTPSAVRAFAGSGNAFLRFVNDVQQDTTATAGVASPSTVLSEPSTPTLSTNLMLGNFPAPLSSNSSSSLICPSQISLLKGGLPSATRSSYELTSIVRHEGDAAGGHYTSYAQRIIGSKSSELRHEKEERGNAPKKQSSTDKKWLHFNDTIMSEENMDAVVSEAASRGCVFLYQQRSQRERQGSLSREAEEAVRVAAQNALMANFYPLGESPASEKITTKNKKSTVKMPRWWLIQAATVNEPGPIWGLKHYVSDPLAADCVNARGPKSSELLSFIFRSRASVAASYPDEWFYVPVPLEDARLMLQVYGGDISC